MEHVDDDESSEEGERDYKDIFHGKQFKELGEAVDWVKAKAKENNFRIVLSSRKNRKSGRVDVSIQCQHSGKPRNENVDRLTRVTSSKRCGCTFRGRISTLRTGGWVILILDGHHSNHAMILYEEGHPEIVAGGSVGRKVIEEMTDAHVMPKQIEVAVNVDETGQKVTRKQIYNVRHQYKLQKADGRTPIQMFAHLTSEARYVTRYRILDNTSEIIGIFWSNPKCISLLRSYPYVLVMDSTYNTNRYNYALLEIIGVTPMNLNFVVAQVLMKKEDKASYFWALECLRELYDANVDPTAIVTDRELGLMEPISVVFPRSPHLLCLFHIKKMVEAKVLDITKSIGYSKDFIVGRFATMIESPTVEDFCSNYLAFRAVI